MNFNITLDSNAVVSIIGFVGIILALYQAHSRFDAMGQRIDAMGQRIDDVHKEIMTILSKMK